jgi:hypothetical protein
MNKTIQFFLLLSCVYFFSWEISAQSNSNSAKNGDPRVVKALDQTKTDYQLDSKGGIYILNLRTKVNRTQKGYIASATENINGVEMRIIFSYAFIADKLPSEQTANLLLQQNMERVGVWAVHKLDINKYAIVNILYIPADFDGEKLDKALSSVVIAADEMEEQLTKKDEN